MNGKYMGLKYFLQYTLPAMILGLFAIVVVCACIYGWVNNIILLAYHHTDTVMVVIRIIGLFTVLPGIILGYINI